MKTGHKHYDLDSCAPKQWKRSVQTKEMENSGLSSSMLSPFCDDLPEFDSEGPEFPPVEELSFDPYSCTRLHGCYISRLRSRRPGVF